MNPITLLTILAIIAVLGRFLLCQRREECHNAEDAPKAKSKKAEASPEAEIPEAEIPEAEILAKMAAGLDRDQAIEVITNQRAWDKSQGL